MNAFRRLRHLTVCGLASLLLASIGAMLRAGHRTPAQRSTASADEPNLVTHPAEGDPAIGPPAIDLPADVPAAALTAYEQAGKEWDTDARTRMATIVIMALFLGSLAFMIELNSSRDLGVLPSGSQLMGALTRVSESLGELGRQNVLGTMLAMLGLQITTAIALSTTATDPAATARVVVATERWLNTLRATSQILAGGVCFAAVGFGVAAAQLDTVPPGTPIVVAVTITSCFLGSAMVDRTDALVSQVGILVQIGQVTIALERLDPLPRIHRGLRSVVRGALSPAYFLIVGAAFVEITRGHGATVPHQFIAALAVLGLFGVSIEWARWGAARSAASWAVGHRFGNKKLLAISYGAIIVVGIVWLPVALLVVWNLTADDLWRCALILLTYVWPMVWLLKDSGPRRLRTHADEAVNQKYRVRPSPTAVASAERTLKQQNQRLQSNLAKWRERVHDASLGLISPVRSGAPH